MTKNRIEQLVTQLTEDIINGTDMELVDVEFVKERDWFLRVYLDKPGGIDVEDCQKVSEALERKLDELDPIPHSYYLEVSSPGLDRPLKQDRDFIRHKGETIEVHTYAPVNGRKDFVGKLVDFDGHNVQVSVDGEIVSIAREQITIARPYIKI